MDAKQKAAFDKWEQACANFQAWIKANPSPAVPPARLTDAVIQTHIDYLAAKEDAKEREAQRVS